ncbi:MAG: endo alpha-1,4 polygalactosaminidase [Bdellovibrionota bacterium]
MRFLIILFSLVLLFPQALLAQVDLGNVKSFAFAIGLSDEELDAEISTLTKYDLVIVDGEGASTDQITQLQNSGTVVLGYISVGTIEKGRFWYKKVKRFKLDLWQDWGEWYANVNKRKFRRVILKRVVNNFLAKGFDGLFLDNVDMVSSHRRQKRGMKKLVKAISTKVKANSGVLFAQNGDEIIDPYLPYLDGWNREDATSTYNFKKEKYQLVSTADSTVAFEKIANLVSAGLFVTTTDYVANGDSETTVLARQASCSAGAIPFVSDILLTQIPATVFECSN